MNNVVYITNPNGEVSRYITFESRLQEFLKFYSVLDGYSVIVETTDYLSKNSGLLSLYKEAIIAGKNPKEVGLPEIREMVVFTAKLLKEGNVLQTASSCKLINYYKDYEIGETAARQRLIASLGYTSGEFNFDETSDMDDQNINYSFQPHSIQQDTAEEINRAQTPVKTAIIESETTIEEPEKNKAPKQAKSGINTQNISTEVIDNKHISVQLIRKIYQKKTLKTCIIL